MYKANIKRIISFLVLTALLLQVFTLSAFAAQTAATEYSEYVTVLEGQTTEFTLTADKDGDYYFSFVYRTVAGRQINPEADLVLSGNGLTYIQHVELYRKWCDVREGERFKTDSYGNEIVPQADEIAEWQTLVVGISAATGNQAVSLKAGQYKLSLSMSCEAVEIAEVSFYEKQLISYADYKKENAGKAAVAKESIPLQAELTSSKSDASIIPTYDRSSPSIQPNYHDRVSLNIIGGGSYSDAGQWIEWSFDAPESGFYTLDVRYQQDTLRGLGVGRRVYIDGEVPFAEFDNILFPYAINYKNIRICDKDGNAYELYLEKGPHTIRMQVNDGHLEKEILEIQQFITECNSMYRQIISITGAAPDTYRDYYLDKELPELMPFLDEAVKKLKDLAKRIEAYSDEDGGSETSIIYDMVRVFDNYIKKPHKIPANLDNFKNSIDSLANMIITLQTQAVTLDYFTFTPVGTELEQNNSNFFAYLGFRFKSFLNTFVANYSISTGNGDENDNVKVWVNMGDLLTTGTASGRDQMQVIKRMCDDSFTDNYNAHVSLSLVSAGDVLTQAILAGKGPDVALFVGEAHVANLALRGVLADMKGMNKFEEISKQYDDSAFIPFKFGDGVYAMPTTQTFNMMFYRTDVFEELGLKAPETWDDFYAVQKVLIQHNLEIGIAESQDIFEMFLLQHGGSIYTDDLSASNLKEQNAVDAFTQWTDLYVKHGLPLAFSFFNRFRTGEMPLGIMSYTMYNQLAVAAPEIEGLWAMLPIPGIRDEKGNITRIQSSSNNAAVVIDTSKNIQGAYNFVEWWASSDIQIAFGRQSEMLLGKSARFNTANRVAFENLNWSANERNNLNSAWDYVSDIPQTAASYYIGRCISNAFRRVAYSYEDTRDVLYRYSDDIDFELERKKEIMERGGKK